MDLIHNKYFGGRGCAQSYLHMTPASNQLYFNDDHRALPKSHHVEGSRTQFLALIMASSADLIMYEGFDNRPLLFCYFA